MHGVQRISSEEANEIIQDRSRIGKFYVMPEDIGDRYIGLDNSTGNCWVEEFDLFMECINWLNGCFEMSEMGDSEVDYESYCENY